MKEFQAVFLSPSRSGRLLLSYKEGLIRRPSSPAGFFLSIFPGLLSVMIHPWKVVD